MLQKFFRLSALSFLMLSCQGKKNIDKSINVINKKDLIGTWTLNRWTLYHTIVVDENKIYVDNHIDSVFYLKYKLKADTLIFWNKEDQVKANKAQIIKLTKDSLVMKGFLETKIIKYSKKL